MSMPSYMALDVGERRIGVAVASLGAKLPRPLTTLEHTVDILPQIKALATEHEAVGVVVGLPRGLEGQETAQTKLIQTFIDSLTAHLSIPVYWRDEAATSVAAEEELRARGKAYSKGDIDALAACYILADFMMTQEGEFR